MKKNESIFRAYDIRGVYGDTLTDVIASYIPASFLAQVPTSKIIIGYDARESSPALVRIITEKFLECGVDVVDIGFVSTDMFYFACGEFNLPGINVTASHNAKEYNGFKMIKKMPHTISKGYGMEELEKGVKEQIACDKTEKGDVITEDIMARFINRLLTISNASVITPLKVVVDAANGTVGPIWKKLSEKIPIELISLYFNPDGTFPNHSPNPAHAENRIAIEDAVKKHRADIGFAFDADGDRCFMIDEKGKTVAPDYCIALIAKALLKNKTETQTIIYTVNTSNVVRDTAVQEGHAAVIEKVGHSYIKETMEKKNILFGGEVSGHYYFKDFYGADSGSLAALILLAIISEENSSLSSLVRRMRASYPITGEINFNINKRDTLMNELKETFNDGTQSELDGFSASYDDWHFNIRASNTDESVVRLSIEAADKALLEQKKDDIIKIINKYT